MKHYKLSGWPDLPPVYHRTAYRRMLHLMSQRFASVAQLTNESGLARPAVIAFLDMLGERQVLREQEVGAPDSLFGNSLSWFRRTISGALDRSHRL
ncbi:hypothetical protein [Rivibacter subsaxonicus]|uniref:IclR-like helix-turn-helix domain-containing protein n=1 Tax=Rivibacter subsaxonicus TaxID=457575 RepID=A0A4Q7VET2_9BURK|nr:hypothetical protein [Rivibacter subsaxonicus]RZT93658.1 hypothetical protein EV670_3209 [Rivibacter subsaxonicus]